MDERSIIFPPAVRPGPQLAALAYLSNTASSACISLERLCLKAYYRSCTNRNIVLPQAKSYDLQTLKTKSIMSI
jgi:hypothetical protein